MSFSNIAICYDFLDTRGGGELVALQLARLFKAPIFTAAFNSNHTYSEFLRSHDIDIVVPDEWVPKVWLLRHEIALRWFRNLRLVDYDLVICLGVLAHFAANSNKNNIWYCFTPWKLLYEPDDLMLPRIVRVALRPWRYYAIRRDRSMVHHNVKKIISISKTVAERVKKVYGKSSTVVYPPIEAGSFRCKSYDDFYLVVSRLVRSKRVRLVVEAFKRMPDKRLIIVGDGSELKTLLKLSRGHSNIKFLGSVPLESLKDLYARCTATIYIPINEDFGMVPLESMASGKPCIAVREGGLRESIRELKNGLFVQPTVNSIIQAVKWLTPERAKNMKEECLETARSFDISGFRERFLNAITQGPMCNADGL